MQFAFGLLPHRRGFSMSGGHGRRSTTSSCAANSPPSSSSRHLGNRTATCASWTSRRSHDLSVSGEDAHQAIDERPRRQVHVESAFGEPVQRYRNQQRSHRSLQPRLGSLARHSAERHREVVIGAPSTIRTAPTRSRCLAVAGRTKERGRLRAIRSAPSEPRRRGGAPPSRISAGTNTAPRTTVVRPRR